MKISPNIYSFVRGFILSMALVFFVPLIAIYVEDQVVNLKVPALLVGIIGSLNLLVITPAILFESLTIESGQLIHKTMLRSKSIEISQMIKIRERYSHKQQRLYFESEDKRIIVNYRLYNQGEIGELIREILKQNPKIDLTVKKFG